MANVFNDHFANVIGNLPSNLPDTNCKHSDFLQSPNSSSMYLLPTSSFKLKRLTEQTKSKMSAGLDCIPSSSKKADFLRSLVVWTDGLRLS